jgi:glyoxylase-like metal-dependent hydrolase (beta-lactamase superfamily II)
MTQPRIRAFFDEPTKTVTYLVWDPATLRGVVIDAVRDFDAASGAVGSKSVDIVLEAAGAEGVRVDWALETHVHADHLSGAPLVKARTGAKIAIGKQVCDVQAAFGPMFGVEAGICRDDFDRLLADGDRIEVGEMVIEVLHVPGHTPADVAYRIGDAAFVGDTLFMPDFGTARTDFPGGCAHQLYRSIRRLLELPPETRLFLCHDYKAPGRDQYAWETTVAAQRAANKHVHDGVCEEEFVAMRRARDAQLPAPALLMPAIQCNIRAGRLPPADADGLRHLRVPLSLQPGASPDALD